jgi:transposase
MRWRRCWRGRAARRRPAPCWEHRKARKLVPGLSRRLTFPHPPGHGRNGAGAFVSSRKIAIPHAKLKNGDRCPECGKGNVYGHKEPKTLVRIVGQAPLAATLYSLERLRCGACGQTYTAQEPEGVGPEKYDETAAAMIAQLKYGSGTAFYRLEQLQDPLVNTPVRSPIRFRLV